MVELEASNAHWTHTFATMICGTVDQTTKTFIECLQWRCGVGSWTHPSVIERTHLSKKVIFTRPFILRIKLESISLPYLKLIWNHTGCVQWRLAKKEIVLIRQIHLPYIPWCCRFHDVVVSLSVITTIPKLTLNALISPIKRLPHIHPSYKLRRPSCQSINKTIAHNPLIYIPTHIWFPSVTPHTVQTLKNENRNNENK